ncbi:hypothetical protein F5Y15DRAFT_367157 [Xylariaceae sp. FL0016]|nr:hypothetical protein F5Y15DRAFT_367157 [Xylariaceae sp. FL0016]
MWCIKELKTFALSLFPPHLLAIIILPLAPAPCPPEDKNENDKSASAAAPVPRLSITWVHFVTRVLSCLRVDALLIVSMYLGTSDGAFGWPALRSRSTYLWSVLPTANVMYTLSWTIIAAGTACFTH